MIPLTWFGAVEGSGASETQNATALAALSSYLAEKRYLHLYVPEGKWFTAGETTIVIPSPGGLHLSGGGQAVSSLCFNTGGLTIAAADQGDDGTRGNSITVSDLDLLCTAGTTHDALTVTGGRAVAGRTTPGAVVRHVNIRSYDSTGGLIHWYRGIVCTRNINPRFFNVTVDPINGKHCLYLHGAAPNHAPIDVVIDQCGFYATAGEGRAHVLIEGAVEGVHMTDCTSIGSDLTLKWIAAQDAKYPWLSFTNNHCVGTNGLDIDRVSDGNVRNNEIFVLGMPDQEAYGLRLRNSQHATLPDLDPSDWDISGNLFGGRDEPGLIHHGVLAEQLTDSVIGRNRFRGLRGADVLLGSDTRQVTVEWKPRRSASAVSLGVVDRGQGNGNPMYLGRGPYGHGIVSFRAQELPNDGTLGFAAALQAGHLLLRDGSVGSMAQLGVSGGAPTILWESPPGVFVTTDPGSGSGKWWVQGWAITNRTGAPRVIELIAEDAQGGRM